MKYIFKTKYSGTQVIWEDGKITSKLGVIQKLEHYNEAVQKSGHGMGFAGSSFSMLPSANYLKTAFGTYLLLSSIEPTEIIQGNIPNDTLNLLLSDESHHTEPNDTEVSP